VTLALGIGANSAIFSFVNGVLLQPLPYAEPDRIVYVLERPPGGTRNAISALNFSDWREQSTVFEALAAVTGSSVTLSGLGEPTLLRGGRVSASYFDVFGIKAALGRTFQPGEDQPGKEHVVVLSHRLWVSQFGLDAGIVGRSLTLDGELYTVIGVMPEGSAFDRGYQQLWRPLAFTSAERTRDFHWMSAIGRLKPGVTIDQARAQMDTIGARIAADFPQSNKGWGVRIDPYADLIVGPQLRSSLIVLLVAVGMLLLIGCVNVANLTLARGTSREREVAVRAALGAGRARLVQQFLTENVLLSLVGGLVGIAVGYGMLMALQVALPPFTLPRDVSVRMDGRVLVFALTLSVVTGILFGLAPALHAARTDLSGAMKEGGRGASGDSGRRRLRSSLVVVEVALAFVLLVGSGLLVRSFFEMMNTDTGFDASNVITMGVPIPNNRFADSAQLTAYLQQIEANVKAVAGVRDAALTCVLPMRGWGNGMPLQIDNKPMVDIANRRSAAFKQVTPSYFQTLGIKLVKGRVLSERDVKSSAPVMVISQTMARRFFSDQEPIGRRILIQEIVPGQPALGAEIPWQVIGVVSDEQTGGLDDNLSPVMYVSMAQSPTPTVYLAARGAVDPTTLQRSIAEAVHQVNKDQPLSDVLTLNQIKDQSSATNKLRTILLGVFAMLSLLLSAIGIYGVIAYDVAQRTQEIGIRSALGATTGSILGLVLGRGMVLATAGLVLGLAGALGLTRLLASVLFGVGARDPLTLATTTVLLASVAALACYIPARRAARLDPLVALRD
jgi:putative ABC transport system permease protein